MKNITIMIGSATRSIKAKNLLFRAGVRAKLIKLDGIEGPGCTHGLEIPEVELYSAAEILRRANIKYKVK